MDYDSLTPRVAEALLSTPQGLRSWLKTKKAQEVVGERKNPLHCMVANYLLSQGAAYAAVHPAFIGIASSASNTDSGRRYFPTPPWVKALVLELDKKSGFVTAKEALAMVPRQARAA